ncbi:hypothetical protein GCM10010124_06180 [Pilimelia terevasa]|uniref:Uncharacterized protein n=2 Tax=Pilimelia terevasa TaxID=53372 RepID=A0A8J3BK56_9ACTN|nr:hypothetical protein GCM10010124_06180 [Pilimelia terevasa]
MDISMDLLRRILDLDHDTALSAVESRAGRCQHRLGSTVRSVARAAGEPVGELGDVLDKLEELRRQTYERIVGVCRGHGATTVLKGSAIAALYPPAVERWSRDVDVWIPDPAALWGAVGELAALYRHAEARVSVIDSTGRRDWAVGLDWVSPSSALEKPYGVELMTVPLSSGAAAVGVRSNLPAGTVHANLLLLAEELFEQEVRGRDILDAAILLDAVPADEMSALHAAADACRLAPELRTLLAAVAAVQGLDDHCCAARLATALTPSAEREQARRSTAPDATVSIRYGYPLDCSRRTAGPRLTEHEGQVLLSSPIGCFLMTSTAEVTPTAVRTALTHCAEH